jgi:glycosyltransferase involved in cell wall biosynthesis
MGKEKPNVLVLATTFPRWQDDNTPKFVHNLSKEIKKESNKVVVLSPHHPDSKFQERMEELQVYRYPYFFPFRYQQLREGSTVEKVQKSFLAKIQLPMMVLSLLLHTAWLIRKEDIEIIHSHWILPNGVAGSIMSSIFRIPHIMTIHAGGALMLKKIPLNERLATYTYKRSDAILPVSSHIKETYERLVMENAKNESKPVVVQPMGTHTGAFSEYDKSQLRSNNETKDETIGLYVGRLAKKKGISYLLQAASSLDETTENFTLVIVGTGPLEEELRSKAKEYGIEHMVEFTGWVSEDELNRHYVSADFVVVPSIETESGDTEGMPTVISEAMAAQNPVIATNVGGIPDVVEDGKNGYIVQQRQPKELAERIDRVINDEDLRHELADNAIDTSKNLDWESCGKTYSNVFQSVIDDRVN